MEKEYSQQQATLSIKASMLMTTLSKAKEFHQIIIKFMKDTSKTIILKDKVF